MTAEVRAGETQGGHEGVQALDLLGRKVRQDDGAGFRTLIDRMRMTTRDTMGDPALSTLGAQLAEAVTRLERVTNTLLADSAELSPIQKRYTVELRAPKVGDQYAYIDTVATAEPYATYSGPRFIIVDGPS